MLKSKAVNSCYTLFCNDDTDQIHDETARQSRSAFGICLSVVFLNSDQILEGSDKSRGLLVFTEVLAGSQAGKARDCYSRYAQVRILPGQPIL